MRKRAARILDAFMLPQMYLTERALSHYRSIGRGVRMHRCSGTAMLFHCTTYPNIPSRLSPRARRIDGHMVPASCGYHASVAAATIAASGVEGVIVALGIVFLFKSISLVVLLFRLCLFSHNCHRHQYAFSVLSFFFFSFIRFLPSSWRSAVSGVNTATTSVRGPSGASQFGLVFCPFLKS